MTRAYVPPKEFRAENGAAFRFSQREDGGLSISILNDKQTLLAGFQLSAEQVTQLYAELERCEECGEPWGLGGAHGPGHCSDPDDPGGDLD